MGQPRYVPCGGGTLIEVSNRTIQGRFLLRPSAKTNDILLGVLGRAQRIFQLPLFAFIFLSDHYHMLSEPENAQHLAEFMEYFDGNLGKEGCRFSRWSGSFWHRRYNSSVVGADEASQVARLRYILANGCKEGLVARPKDWPGVSSTSALLDGSMRLQGTWFDRTLAYRARRKGLQEVFPAIETVELSPLPCFANLTPNAYRERVASIVSEVEQETAEMHRRNQSKPLGRRWVMKQNPHRVPKKLKRSPARKFLTAFRRDFIAMREAYDDFLNRYREASRRLRSGDLTVEFPRGCFPPALPYVRAGP
jgi:putative transposase